MVRLRSSDLSMNCLSDRLTDVEHNRNFWQDVNFSSHPNLCAWLQIYNKDCFFSNLKTARFCDKHAGSKKKRRLEENIIATSFKKGRDETNKQVESSSSLRNSYGKLSWNPREVVMKPRRNHALRHMCAFRSSHGARHGPGSHVEGFQIPKVFRLHLRNSVWNPSTD